MSENNKHPSAGRGRKRAGWFRRLFFGGSKTLADDMLETDRYGQQKIEDVEVILSPGKQIVKGFFEKKYAVVALVVVVVMFLIAFVGPLFMPKYFDAYSENTQQSIYPTLSMMKMPKELQKDVKQVSSYGPFTVGLSGSGKVYVWGCTQIGTTGFDVSRIPEDVQKANIVMVAAGIDHIIAIDDKGKIYGWGNYKLGQYGRYDEFADTSFVLPIPQELYDNGVDVSKVKKLTCGYQSTAILMEDGTLYVWGNKNAYSNMEFFATLNEVDETLDFVPEQTLLKDIHDNLYAMAEKNLEDNTFDFSTWEEVKEMAQGKGGFARTKWCGSLECELAMKEKAGVSSRCMPLKQSGTTGKCPVCGKECTTDIYWGVAY